MTLRWLPVVFLVGCAATPIVVQSQSEAPIVSACDMHQTQLLHDADTRATPWSTAQHLAKNFPDGRVAWVMKDTSYQSFVVKTEAKSWGRCDATGCFVFTGPAAVIHAAVEHSITGGHHDSGALGKALGLPSSNFDGPLRMMTLDLHKGNVCARLPVDSDLGVQKCTTAADTDCFKFGGYTSGGVPELMIINAPVNGTVIEKIE